MGRQTNSDDPTALQSSIALLQERFRQLQRIKEMREERELLRVFAEAAERPSMNPSNQCEQTKWFFHPDRIHPSWPLHGPPSYRDGREFCQACEISLSTGLWPKKANIHTSKNYDDTDVDTSLHL